jgi:hypothetical protein
MDEQSNDEVDDFGIYIKRLFFLKVHHFLPKPWTIKKIKVHNSIKMHELQSIEYIISWI